MYMNEMVLQKYTGKVAHRNCGHVNNKNDNINTITPNNNNATWYLLVTLL